MGSLHYEGSHCFRIRIVLSTISRRNITISNIRTHSSTPGLKPYEVSFLRLIDQITDGMKLTVNPSGTQLSYNPGLLIGVEPDKAPISHNCSKDRSLIYHLEGLALLAPFCKFPLDIKLSGVTHSTGDISIDNFRLATIPLIKKFGIPEGINLKIYKRGAKPNGGGDVRFYCPTIKTIKPIQWVQKGRVKRIRGVAYSNKVSSLFTNKIIRTVRGILNDFLPDVWIYNDECLTGKNEMPPAFGISITAETYKNSIKCADIFFDTTYSLTSQLKDYDSIFNSRVNHITNNLDLEPLQSKSFNKEEIEFTDSNLELLGKTLTWKLLKEIKLNGVVDTSHQHIPLIFMALAEEHNISELQISSLTPYTVQVLKHLHDFFGTKFIISGEQNKGLNCKCIGSGFKNLASKTH